MTADERSHEVRHLRGGEERHLAGRGVTQSATQPRVSIDDRRDALVDSCCVFTTRRARGERLGEALGLVRERAAAVVVVLLVHARRARPRAPCGRRSRRAAGRSRPAPRRRRRGPCSGRWRSPSRPARRGSGRGPRPAAGAAAGASCRSGSSRTGRRPRGRASSAVMTRDHAGHRLGRGGVDAGDRGVRRTASARTTAWSMPGQHEVVDVAALAGDERRVLLAQDALADAAGGGSRARRSPCQALAISPAACFDGGDDVLVAGAAAEVALQRRGGSRRQPGSGLRRRCRPRPSSSRACRTRTGGRAARGTPAGSGCSVAVRAPAPRPS